MIGTPLVLFICTAVAVNRGAKPMWIAFFATCFGVAASAGRFGSVVDPINEAIGGIFNDLLQNISGYFGSGASKGVGKAGFIQPAFRYNVDLILGR